MIRLPLLVMVLVGASAGWSRALAEDLEVIAPYAEARAVYYPPIPSSPAVEDWKVDGNYYPFDLFIKPKYAFASAGKATAQAAASVMLEGHTPRFGLVTTRSLDDGSTATAVAIMLFDVSDPQHRARVLVDVDFKTSAEVRSGGTASAFWRLGKANHESGRVTLDGGKITRILLPEDMSWHPNYGILGGNVHVIRGTEDDPGLVEQTASVQGREVFRQLHQAKIAAKTFVPLQVEPGTYAMVITAMTTGEAIVVNDPVIVPNAANPDVGVTIQGAVDPTPRAPLLGMTADDLVAAGFDPSPFAELGFVDAPASTTTTTLPESTTTTLPESTSTTLPETTTTTLPTAPTCAAGEAGALVCLCEHDPGVALCPGEPLPGAIVRRLGQGCRFVTRATSVGAGPRQRRALARAAGSFAHVLRTLGRDRVARTLSPSCRSALTTGLGAVPSRGRPLGAGR